MRLKNVIYSKKFISRTEKEDVSYHGSPIFQDCQRLNTKDKKIRKELIRNFSLKNMDFYHDGFDGKIMYTFSISGEPITDYKQRSKNREYLTEIVIEKAGDLKHQKTFSDIELFLRENNFKES